MLLLFQLIMPALENVRAHDARARCKSRLTDIGVGLHYYHDVNGAFPAATVHDAQGKPMHSWRVYSAGFIESDPRLNLYDIRIPWDSPANAQVWKDMKPPWFACPSSPTAISDGVSTYVMIVGDEAASQPGTWTRVADLEDPANTIVVAEIATSDILWAEPRDLEFDKMSFRINDPGGNCISSHHPGGAHVLMADGSVRFLADHTDPAVVKSLMTKDAGDNPMP
jgi:prepilin-type processing-associated H-X9-DG protein